MAFKMVRGIPRRLAAFPYAAAGSRMADVRGHLGQWLQHEAAFQSRSGQSWTSQTQLVGRTPSLRFNDTGNLFPGGRSFATEPIHGFRQAFRGRVRPGAYPVRQESEAPEEEKDKRQATLGEYRNQGATERHDVPPASVQHPS